MKDKIIIILTLLLIGLMAIGIGWFIGQLVLMSMEVGG